MISSPILPVVYPDPISPTELVSCQRATEAISSLQGYARRRFANRFSSLVGRHLHPDLDARVHGRLTSESAEVVATTQFLLAAERREIATYARVYGDAHAYELRPAIWEGALLPAINPIVLAETGALAAIGCLLPPSSLPERLLGAPIFVSRTDLERIITPERDATEEEVISEATEIVASVPPSIVMLKKAFFHELRLRCGDVDVKRLSFAWRVAAPKPWRLPGRRLKNAAAIISEP